MYRWRVLVCLGAVWVMTIFGGSAALAADTPLQTVAQIPQAYRPPYLPVYENDVLVNGFQFAAGEGFSYIELANTSNNFVDLSRLNIRLLASDSAQDYECTVGLDGFLRPKSNVTIVERGAAVAVGAAETVLRFDTCGDMKTAALDRRLEVVRAGSVIERIYIEPSDMPANLAQRAWQRKSAGVTARTGQLATDFKVLTAANFASSQLYLPSKTLPFEVTEILPTVSQNCTTQQFLSEKTACRKYIKLRSTAPQSVDLSQYRLRTGSPTTKSISSNTSQLSGILLANTHATIDRTIDGAPLVIAAEGNVWFEDMYGLVMYPTNVPVYAGADLVANRGASWAQFDGGWDWALPSPEQLENRTLPPKILVQKAVIDTRVPCKDGQYRSEETGRCRNLALAGDTLKPCKEGQYRSEETNRCRSIAATAAASLKPCADDQFRNPETNRCKKIASTDDVLKPCADGYERNLETNRCRKIRATDIPSATYPVQPVADSAEARTAWWVVGGLVAAGAAYGAWEWRYEILKGMKRIVSMGKK